MPIDTTTDLEFKNAIVYAKARGKATKTFDGSGLFLIATMQGGKVWRINSVLLVMKLDQYKTKNNLDQFNNLNDVPAPANPTGINKNH